jgi:hypothetical protein
MPGRKAEFWIFAKKATEQQNTREEGPGVRLLYSRQGELPLREKLDI